MKLFRLIIFFSLLVFILNGVSAQFCTEDYVPVCGQSDASAIPITYSNRCKLDNSGAKLLYTGQCKADTCTDNDNGLNYYKKGTAIQCSASSGSTACKSITDSCSSGSNLIESYCSRSITVETQTYICPNGCLNGICKAVCTEDYVPVCGQSDASAIPITYSNRCKLDNSGAKFLYTGVCKAINSCIDSDNGLNYYIKGDVTTCSNMQGEPGSGSVGCALHVDSCPDNKNLLEYGCNGSSITSSNYACPNGCNDGACLKNVDCKPVCKEIGTRSEGWYDSCSGELINYENCGTDTICTEDYVPVCGQSDASAIPITYSNRCKLDNSGAKLLYTGECNDNSVCRIEGQTCGENMEKLCCAGLICYFNPNADPNADISLGTCTKPTVCTDEYKPVCGQPPMPTCPPGLVCTTVMPSPMTYFNRCKMENAGITFLYEGTCRIDSPCLDTDGGTNYYLIGTASDKTGSFTDSCTYCTGACAQNSGDCKSTCGAVIEYSCENNKVKQNEPFGCENGCAGGACQKKTNCKPVCKEIGTRSEGWYDSCSGELINYENCGSQECKADSDCEFYFSSCSCSWVCGKKEVQRIDCARACPKDSMQMPELAPDCGCSNGKCEIDNNCKKEGEMCGGIAGFACCDVLTCKLDGTYPDAAGRCTSYDSKDIAYHVSTDKKIYKPGDTVVVTGTLKGKLLPDIVSPITWITTPDNQNHKVILDNKACLVNACKSGEACSPITSCSFIGEYVVGKSYPAAEVESYDEELLSQTETEVVQITTETTSVITGKVTNEKKEINEISEPNLKNRFKIMSIALFDGQKIGAKTFFFVSEYKGGSVDILINDKYVQGKNMEINVKNNLDTEISYTSLCEKPYVVERYVKGNGFVAVGENPCAGQCEAFKYEKLAPGAKAKVGEWTQKVYSDNCEESQAESGLYRIIFRYRKDSEEILSNVLKEFKVASGDNWCEPICKAISTKSEGWYDSCTGELIRYELCGSNSCNGCSEIGKCLPYGTRLTEEDIPVYCDINSDLKIQKKDTESCQNNYECISNSCISGNCADLQAELKETRNMIQKFWDWLKRIF